MTARTVAKLRGEGKELNEMTQRNVEKVTQFRPDGKKALERMVKKIKGMGWGDGTPARSYHLTKEWVYPTHDKEKQEMEKKKKKKLNEFLI